MKKRRGVWLHCARHYIGACELVPRLHAGGTAGRGRPCRRVREEWPDAAKAEEGGLHQLHLPNTLQCGCCATRRGVKGGRQGDGCGGEGGGGAGGSG